MKKILVLIMIQILVTSPALALYNPAIIQSNSKTNHNSVEVDWWPMFYHDEARTGNTSSPAPDINHTIWNHTVDGFIESSPSLVDGKAYITTCNWWEGHIHCLDLYNGSYVWNYTINDQLFSSPAVHNGRVYVASLNGRFLCINASTGQQIWNHLLDTDIMIQSSPVIYGGRIYISRTNEYPATNKSKLYCLHSEDGSVAWYNSTKNAKDISPAVVDGKVYAAGMDNILTCFDALTGDVIWQSDEQITTSHPVVVNNNVFGSSDDSVYCIHNGTTQWEFPLKEGFLVASSIVIGSGRLFVGALNPLASIPGMIHCIDIETGDEYWNYSSENNGEYNAKPTIAQNRLFIVEDTGVGQNRRARICCFDIFTGDLVSAHFINNDSTNYVYGTLSMADGLLVLGSAESDSDSFWGGIYCYGEVTVSEPDLTITKISGGNKLTIEIENSGNANATGVTGELVITGGFFIHQGTYAFPDTIPAGTKADVVVPLFGVGFGLLKAVPQISVNVTCAEHSTDTAIQHFKIFLSRVKIVEDN
ncbi:MAG: PQQ-like beta-propeller repeat protein [Thermoplasmata archaeon]|nr:PQQ-like beta-propeller repeat protein [Thermoplasmata archaeon]